MPKWNSNANIAAMLGIPVALVVLGIFAFISGKLGGTMSIGTVAAIFLVSYAFAFSSILHKRAGRPRQR